MNNQRIEELVGEEVHEPKPFKEEIKDFTNG